MHLNAQPPDILDQNRALLKSISHFSEIDPVNENYIRFWTRDIRGRNESEKGIAERETGRIVYPEGVKECRFMTAEGSYLVFAKETNQSGWLYGMMNSKGDTVLGFKYRMIGSSFVPLPDTMIPVSLGEKYGIFNTKTGVLSDIKYENAWNLNDGYSYHEGNSGAMRAAVYEQLGIRGFHEKNSGNKCVNKVEVAMQKGKACLINEQHKVISGKYKYIKRLSDDYSKRCDLRYCDRCNFYFVATLISNGSTNKNANPEYVLLDQSGAEVAKISSESPEYDDHYIELLHRSYTEGEPGVQDSRYFFIETKQIVTVPKEYNLYVTCYSHNGFLGFKHRDNGKKLFVDKYGNMLEEKDL